MARERIDIDLTAKDNASSKIDEVAEKTEGLEAGAEVELGADDQASDEIEGVEGAVDDLDGSSAEVEAEATDDATPALEGVEDAVDDLDGQSAEVQADATDDATPVLESVESAVADLDGQTAEVSAEADVEDANTQLSGFGAGLAAAKTKASGFASQLSGAGPLAIAGGAAIGGAAISAFAVKAVNDYADIALAAQELSVATGLTVEESSRWLSLAGDLDINARVLEAGLGRLNREAGTNAQKFDEFGVAIARTDSGAADVNKTFFNVLDTLKNTEDPARRARIAQELLGRQYQNLSVILGMTREEIQAELDATNEWEVVTNEAAESARRWSRATDQLGDVINSFTTETGKSLMPLLTDIVETGSDVGGVMRTIADSIPGASSAMDGAKEAGSGLTDALFGAFTMSSNFSSLWGGGGKAFEATEAAKASNQRLQEQFDLTSESMDVGTRSSEKLAAAEEDAQVAAEALTLAHDQQAASIQAVIDTNEELVGGFKSYADTVIALEDAQQSTTSAVDKLNETLADQEAEADDVKAAQDRVRDAVIKESEAEVKNAEAKATSEGRTATLTEKIDIQNSSLLTQASNLDGPVRQAILDHITNLNGIPDEVASEIQALIDQGKVDEAEALLNETSRARDAAVNAQAHTSDAERELNELAREREVRFRAVPVGGSVQFQHGGLSHGNTALVGEAGPELVRLPAGSRVHGAQQSQMMGTGGRGGDIHVTVNTSSGDGRAIAKAVERELRWATLTGL